MAKANGDRRECAMVTGASAGIGLELARLLAEKSYDVVLLARSRDKLVELAGDIQSAHGIQATVVTADLTDPAAPQTIFDELEENGIAIDFLVNNAGVLEEGAFASIDLDRHLALLQVNIVSLTALTRLFLAPMLRRNKGRILNVASIAAFMPVPQLAVYAASKAFVLALTEALSEELKTTGVSVTALCPGVTETGMVKNTRLGSVPDFMIMDAKSVAQAGYGAVMSGRAVHVAGMANELAVQWIKYQPDWLVRAISGALARGRMTDPQA